jgi:hypothetical protein
LKRTYTVVGSRPEPPDGRFHLVFPVTGISVASEKDPSFETIIEEVPSGHTTLSSTSVLSENLDDELIVIPTRPAGFFGTTITGIRCLVEPELDVTLMPTYLAPP